MTDREPANQLPRSWVEVSFDQLFANVTSSALKLPKSDYQTDARYPVIDQGEALIGGYTDRSELVHPGPIPAIVFGDHTRSVKFARVPFVQGADGVKVLAPSPVVSADYAYWVLKSTPIPNKGYARHFSLLRKLTFPLSPVPEQHRIVEAIESYFTRLDDAVATLERVRRNLKRYRASVLKAAVEGRLVPTEAEVARADGRDYEPASVLLDRVLTEHSRRWERDAEDRPSLPEGWEWATLDQIAEIKGGITKGQKRKEGLEYREVPYLRVANVQRGYLDLTVMKTILASEDKISDLRLEYGDVLFNEGGDRDKLGRGWVWKGEIPECIHQNHVFRARILANLVIPEFVSWYGNTEGQRYFWDQGKHTTNLASINMTKLRGLPVPIPPAKEQVRIFEAVGKELSVIDEVLRSTHREQSRCTRLRQSILKWAFEGRLVDHDPTDEPASALFEKIRNEREKSAQPVGKRRAR